LKRVPKGQSWPNIQIISQTTNILKLKALYLGHFNFVSICLFYFIYTQNPSHKFNGYLFVLTLFTVILNVLICVTNETSFLEWLGEWVRKTTSEIWTKSSRKHARESTHYWWYLWVLFLKCFWKMIKFLKVSKLKLNDFYLKFVILFKLTSKWIFIWFWDVILKTF
jgi:hypothetical protein